MSGEPSDDTTGQLRPEGDNSDEKVETANENEGDVMPSPQEEINPFAQWDLTEYLQEAAIKKKYGGIVPRKPPLISKDHERAYFDSADWALGKQGGNPQKPKGPLEALRPKLQPTQQQARSVGFLMHLLTTKRVSIRPLNFELHSGHVVSTTFCCSMFDTCNNL